MKTHTRSIVVQALKDAKVRERLVAMENDPSLHKVKSTYNANNELYPNNQMPFRDKHYDYLLKHPDVDPDQYLSNLRLMLKK